MITTENLSKIYRTDEVQTTALNKVSLKINEGEFVAIMGPSGCGKSTLLNILGLLDKASNGSYKFLNNEIVGTTEKTKSVLRKKNIGFIFQNFNLIDELSVFENIELPLLYNGVPSSERKKRVNEIMQKTQIDHRGKHYPQQLSGGQQQRVAVARALVTKTKTHSCRRTNGKLGQQQRKRSDESTRRIAQRRFYNCYGDALFLRCRFFLKNYQYEGRRNFQRANFG